MKNILITGVGGLFGANFSRYFLEKKYNVIGIDDFSGGYKEFVPKDVKLYEGNLADSNFTDNVFKDQKPDYVLHFAAYAAEGLSHFIRNYNYTNNVISSVNVINSCLKYETQKLIFTSSMAVYGENEIPFTENMTPNPEDPYGIAKFTVEQDLKIAGKFQNLNYSIIRPHNVIGKYQNIWDRYRNVIGIWCRKIINNEPVTIFGDGMQTRAFSDIHCYYEPIEKLLVSNNRQTFNLGGDKFITLLDAANILCSISKTHGYNPSIVHLEERFEVKHAFCNHDKAKKLLDFKDSTDMIKLFEEIFTWALTQENKPVKNMNYEITNNLYNFWK